MSPDAATALLVVDLQEGFRDPVLGRRNNPTAEQRVAELLAAWRRAGAPALHVQHDSPGTDGLFRRGTPGNLPMPETAAIEGERVYRKIVSSAFIGTKLEADLRAAGIEALVIVGLTTNHCVSTTARMAGNLGFRTFVVEDATATFDRIGLDGRVRPAAEVHAAALSDLDEEFATIVTTATILDTLSKITRRNRDGAR
ncbi:cysteine hydrolase family protein [Sphingomonas profundi]|uniref:cysteine hydrolase family protein n=1 Tax=Alterirhizorhabdus profundi TaxID=2681549 RepID=UPI0012E7C9E7|nr:cysteine hydrolase family protein [Sphingomonas profundi]